MDSVFVITQNPPKELSTKEMVIAKPLFLDEVRVSFKRKGSRPTLGPNYLRAIAEEIGRRYDKTFNPFRNVVPTDYVGRVCESDEAVAEVIHEMFQTRYPVIYQRYYETLIRARPFSIRVIYFTGNPDDAVVFKRLGITQIQEDEVYRHLGLSKPTVTHKVISKVEVSKATRPVPAASQSQNDEMSKTLEILANSAQEPILDKPKEVAASLNTESMLSKPIQRQSALKKNCSDAETPVVTAQKQA
jgi:hypothetical protein